MAQLSVICSKTKIGITEFDLITVPNKVSHWIIYVNYPFNNKWIYHVKTKTITSECVVEIKDWDVIKKANKISNMVAVGYPKELSHCEMEEICQHVSEKRNFNIITNNCQDWVLDVLRELFKRGHLHHSDLEYLRNEISPLRGQNCV